MKLAKENNPHFATLPIAKNNTTKKTYPNQINPTHATKASGESSLTIKRNRFMQIESMS